jgi:hypothetical protein
MVFNASLKGQYHEILGARFFLLLTIHPLADQFVNLRFIVMYLFTVLVLIFTNELVFDRDCLLREREI